MNTISSQAIQENSRRSYLYMALMMMAVGVLGHFISRIAGWGLTGTGTFLLISAAINLVAYYFSDRLVLLSTNAKPLTEDMAPEYIALVTKLCRKADLPLPKLYYMDTEAMNAYATGRDKNHAAVVVTRGLLEKLQPDEVAGVVSHELAHIERKDMLVMTVVVVLAGLLSILADLYWRSNLAAKASEKDKSGFMQWFGLALSISAPLVGMLLQLAVSRSREYAADARGVGIAGSNTGLLNALKKLAKDRVPLPGSYYATSHLFLNSPYDEESWLDKIMSTHPPMSERIHRLETMSSL